MTEELRAVHARLIKLAADILKQRHWGDRINARDALRQDDALADLGYEAGQIAKLLATPAPAQPEGSRHALEAAAQAIERQANDKPARYDFQRAATEGMRDAAAIVRGLAAGAAASVEGAASLRQFVEDVARDPDEHPELRQKAREALAAAPKEKP